MKDLRAQEQDLIFALDIGTRSVVGVVGRPSGGRFKALDIEMAEHGSRAMLDGQIDNIHQVGSLARTVTDRLEERLGVRLERVCVAAAGRALRTQSGSFTMDISAEKTISAETISRLEAGALSAAEEALQMEDEVRRQFFMVGYTVAQYRLDNYPLASLLDHNGQKAEADVVATFLPGEVVESLYAAMRTAGLQVSSLTLEPIAAMNAAIPVELRLLNLALVDIGAGTTDIAVCRDGSVTGYTMATIAGDEITEAIMRTFLVDFQTAEEMKRNLRPGEDVCYTDILGLENTAAFEELYAAIQEPMGRLAEAIAVQVTELNGGAPSALFLAGGGSKLEGLREKVAASLGMDERRVAIAGNNFAKSAFADEMDLNNPEYATPLGIAISAGLGLLNDSYVITLNGETAKLFRSGTLTVRDILLMNGYTYADMLGRSGKNLGVTLNGRRMVLRGEPAAPAILRVNGEEAAINAVVHAGDSIRFQPARSGRDAAKTLGELLGKDFSGRVLLNNREGDRKAPLRQGDVILTLEGPAGLIPPLPEQPEQPEKTAPQPEPDAPPPAPLPEEKAEPVSEEPPQPEPPKPVKPRIRKREVEILLNGKPVVLPPKENGQPYYVMDLLERSGVDFEKLEGPVRLAVNGTECGFSQAVKDRDSITIH
ncbi:cell division protein FtsA [Oscillibacter sp.]|uniref:cell division protein FtsA n=1 Tax=Oscillibacter sp. TaxID=1945593 RepID=UPI00216BC8D9|nr:cell division FtsA domain-containing protein [Oscillibacter sp.]MCI9240361.1 pilus assembly protein PilM [Oscillibacter sp.]